jgi:biopolymer transport protein ExbD
MRLPQRRRGQGLRFDITPLIDVVFNLVIFFLVATHFVSSEAREPVELPEASETDERPPAPRRLVVTVLDSGEYRVKGQPVTLPAVAAMIAEGAAEDAADFEVQIRADRAVEFASAVEPLLVACAQRGVTRVGVNKLDP